MFNKLYLSMASAVATLSVGTIAQAATIVQPTAVSTSMGSENANFDVTNIINQSGLSQTYTSGVDDFDTYIGLNPTHSGNSGVRWFSSQPTGQVTCDLGEELNTTRLAFWNGFSGGRVTSFEVYSDDDGDFDNGGTTLLGSFDPLALTGNPVSVEVFDFTDAITQFIHFNITGAGAPNATTVSEVAFEVGEATPPPTTPEPSTVLALMGLGLGVLASRGKRQA